MDKEKIEKILTWLMSKHIVSPEIICHIDEDVIEIKFLEIIDLFGIVRRLLEVGIRFSVIPGFEEKDYYIQILLSDMDWDKIFKEE